MYGKILDRNKEIFLIKMIVDEVNSMLAEKGWSIKIKLLWDLTDRWGSVVDECRQGYFMGIEEYDNDISIRDAIELVILEESIHRYSEYPFFKQKVEEIDQKFRLLLQDNLKRPDKNTWWRQGVLKIAGKQLTDDFLIHYGLHIANIEYSMHE